jgi:hypothetical protein
MILQNDALAQILREDGTYDCSLIQQLFAYKLIRESVSPLGNVFCFEAPTIVGPIGLDSALVIAGEIPKIDTFGGACFQRLYASQIGTLITMFTGEDCWLDQNCLFVNNSQASITMLNQIKNSIVFHTIIPTKHSIMDVDFYKLQLTAEKMVEFKQNVVDCFRQLTENIFIETRRDNF